MATVAESLLTAEEFARRPQRDAREELVHGRIIVAPPPGEEHGTVLGNFLGFVHPFVRANGLGRITVGDSGIVLSRGPDTVRGPDMTFCRTQRLATPHPTRGYPDVLPDLVVEVRSPSDRWNDVLDKVQEYLTASIIAIVIDPGPREVHIFEPDQPVRVLGAADVFDLPGLWPGLAFPVLDLFL